MKSFLKSYGWMIAFAVVYLALRLFWITCDTGIPSIWEYGFHTTDEGYYLCGGKEKLLWGSFVDLTRQEALNYCYSYGTHWLSYLAHLCFGLSTWSWRIPFVGLYFIAWMMVFATVKKQSGAIFAFVTCVAASSLPLVVTYERGASNDATIAALVAIAFALGMGRGSWRLGAAALATSAITTIKPSVWVMMPIVLSAILTEKKTRSAVWDAVIFVGLTIALVFGWKLLSALSVLGVAHENALSPWQVLARVNATYGLPSITDIAQDFRALASFPRDPAIKTMGVTALMISVVPAAMFLTNIVRRKWSARLLLEAMVPLYAFALNVINSMYTHYFLPLLILLPFVFSALQADFAEMKSDEANWKDLFLPVLILLAALGIGGLFLSSEAYDIKSIAQCYSRIYNLPQQNPWRTSWGYLVTGTLLGCGLLTCFRGRKALCREGWVWAICLFLVFSISFAALPALVLAPRLRLSPDDYLLTIVLNLMFGCTFAFTLFARAKFLARPTFVAALMAVPIVVSYLVLPTWQSAAIELLTRHTHYDAMLAGELKQLLPEDAILLGERSDQALMSLPIRAVSTFLTASNPIPYADEFFKRDPNAKVYALIDPDCNFNLQHFQQHADTYQLAIVKTFQMPSTGNGRLKSITLCRVIRK